MLKKKTAILLSLIFCLVLVVGIAYLFNEIFPKARPMESPDPADLVSVTLGCNTTNGEVTVNEDDFEDLILHLSTAKPTRRQSLNDTPTVWPYYCLEIQAEEGQYRSFVYEEVGQVYIEVPYEGIYEADMILLELVLQYFEER